MALKAFRVAPRGFMARYFFHLRSGDGYVPDVVGSDLERSRECARHLMQILNRSGAGDYRVWVFEIADESGAWIDTIRVQDLLGAVH